jgi:hypothetical protein
VTTVRRVAGMCCDMLAFAITRVMCATRSSGSALRRSASMNDATYRPPLCHVARDPLTQSLLVRWGVDVCDRMLSHNL